MDSDFHQRHTSLPSLSATTSDNNDFNDLPDPDEDFILFPEEDQGQAPNHSSPDVTKEHSPASHEEAEYILGTIIVRVVAAKGLVNPNQENGGFFRNSSAPATVNPYASVKFGKTTQRTSDVYSNRDPVWPRDEVFFMDLSLPVSQLTHCRESSISDETVPSSLPRNENIEDTTALLGDPYYRYKKPENATLTVAVFHTEFEKPNTAQKLFKEKNISGDSDDAFLGMASIDLTRLITGRVPEVDTWLPLTGTSSSNEAGWNQDHHSLRIERHRGASVRIMCEYEVSDMPPKAGDICRFTRYCHPRDLFPLEPTRPFKVDRVHNDGNAVFLAYTSQEGWLLSFQAHKNMLVCEERHISALNTAQDELQTLGERLSVSPLVTTVTQTAARVVDDGVVGIAEGLVRGSAFVFDRWFKGGVDTVLRDLQDITNLDGRHNVDNIGRRLDLDSPASSSSSLAGENIQGSCKSKFSDPLPEEEAEAIPNMPSCPITGFPMVDPVVAADGHTYERSAIARWLKTSNKSPMTGSILFHKELVPNYGLVSSIQEVAAREKEDLASS